MELWKTRGLVRGRSDRKRGRLGPHFRCSAQEDHFMGKYYNDSIILYIL